VAPEGGETYVTTILGISAGERTGVWVADLDDEAFGEGAAQFAHYFRAVCAGPDEVRRMAAEDTTETAERICHRALKQADQIADSRIERLVVEAARETLDALYDGWQLHAVDDVDDLMLQIRDGLAVTAVQAGLPAIRTLISNPEGLFFDANVFDVIEVAEDAADGRADADRIRYACQLRRAEIYAAARLIPMRGAA
jgi:hypothetical protein